MFAFFYDQIITFVFAEDLLRGLKDWGILNEVMVTLTVSYVEKFFDFTTILKKDV